MSAPMRSSSAQADRVVDEAGEEVVAEHLGREAAAEVGAGPHAVVLVDVVGPLEQVRRSSRSPPSDSANRMLGNSLDAPATTSGRQRCP